MTNNLKKKNSTSPSTVWSGDNRGNIIIWKGESKSKKFWIKTGAYSMCFSPSVYAGLNIWIGSIGFVVIYDTEKHEQVNLFKLNSGVISGMILIDKHVWIASHAGLNVWDSETFKEVEIPSAYHQMSLFSIASVYTEKKNDDLEKIEVWAGSSKSIYVFNALTRVLMHKLDIHSDKVLTLLPIEEENQVWSGSRDKSIYRWYYHVHNVV